MTHHPIAQIAQNGNPKSPENRPRAAVSCKIDYFTRSVVRLEKLSPAAVKDSTLAGEPITAKLSRAPGNDAPIDWREENHFADG
jgi:hypothetical protein